MAYVREGDRTYGEAEIKAGSHGNRDVARENVKQGGIEKGRKREKRTTEKSQRAKKPEERGQ